MIAGARAGKRTSEHLVDLADGLETRNQARNALFDHPLISGH